MAKVGDVIDKYRLTRLLGQGGMGEVYAAENTLIGKTVALKLLKPELAGEEAALRRFVQEARTAAGLDHPGIAEIFDFGWTEQRSPFLVMELLKGVSLDQLLSQHGKFEIDQAIEIVTQMLSVLMTVHNRSIVHRDLKPENIFLCRERDGSEIVKVLDFGISKVKTGPQADRLTHTGVVLGTAYYMAPEQARGDHDIDFRVDIWALGVIFYEMLTGKMPFFGDSYNQVLSRILTYQVAPLRELRSGIPDWLERVVNRAMAWDRDDRYPSAGAFLGDIQAYTASVEKQPPKATAALFPMRDLAPIVDVSKGFSSEDVSPEAPTEQVVVDTVEPSTSASLALTERRSTSSRSTKSLIVIGVIVLLLGAMTGVFAVTSWNEDEDAHVVENPVVIETPAAPSQVDTVDENDGTLATSTQREEGDSGLAKQARNEQHSKVPVVLPDDDVERALRDVRTKLRRCLGRRSPPTSLDLVIDEDGSARLDAAGRELQSSEERCLTKLLAGVHFTEFDSPRVATVHLRARHSSPRVTHSRPSSRPGEVVEPSKTPPSEDHGEGPTKRNPFDE